LVRETSHDRMEAVIDVWRGYRLAGERMTMKEVLLRTAFHFAAEATPQDLEAALGLAEKTVYLLGDEWSILAASLAFAHSDSIEGEFKRRLTGNFYALGLNNMRYIDQSVIAVENILTLTEQARKGIKVQEQSCGHIRRLIGILDEVGVLEKVALDQPRAALFYYVIASFFQRHTISEIHEKLRAIGRQSLFEYYFDNTGWKPDHLNKLALHGRAGMFSSRNIHDGVEAARQAMDRAVEEILPNDFGPLHLKTPGEVYIWLAFNSGKKQVVMERLARPVKFIIQIPVAGAKAREAVISVNCKADRIGLLHDITAVLKAAQVNIKTIVTRGRKVRIAIGPAIPLSGVMAMMDIFSG
ncbi:MAG: hypothetical protein COY78_00005, partial [Candidatus Omnitrophica bacterium CG_4_10_14_0_8_um_filter_44_12]